MSIFLIVLGVFVIVFGAIALNANPQNKNLKNIKTLKSVVRVIGIVLILIGSLSSCFVQIENGYLGVTKLFGKVQKEVLSPGLNFINPLFTVEELDTRTQNYTMSATHGEGVKQGDDAMRVLTSDGLEVSIDLTVLYRISKKGAPKLLQEIGADYVDKIVRPVSRTKIRDNAVRFQAVSLYSTKREEFQDRIYKSIEKEFSKRGIILENVLIRNVTLPARVKESIEQKIQAEQESQKMQFVLLKEKQEAERKRVEAQGIADYQQKINSTLTSKLIQFEQIKAYKEMAASQNAKMIIMGNGKAPIILNDK